MGASLEIWAGRPIGLEIRRCGGGGEEEIGVDFGVAGDGIAELVTESQGA